MPKVHFAAPGSQAALASSAAGWSTIRPPTAIGSPKAVVVPTMLVTADDRGSGSSCEPEQLEQLLVPLTRSMSSSSERLAVDASVTNSPDSRWMQPESVVVTTPSRVTLRRSQAIFGAEK